MASEKAIALTQSKHPGRPLTNQMVAEYQRIIDQNPSMASDLTASYNSNQDTINRLNSSVDALEQRSARGSRRSGGSALGGAPPVPPVAPPSAPIPNSGGLTNTGSGIDIGRMMGANAVASDGDGPDSEGPTDQRAEAMAPQVRNINQLPGDIAQGALDALSGAPGVMNSIGMGAEDFINSPATLGMNPQPMPYLAPQTQEAAGGLGSLIMDSLQSNGPSIHEYLSGGADVAPRPGQPGGGGMPQAGVNLQAGPVSAINPQPAGAPQAAPGPVSQAPPMDLVAQVMAAMGNAAPPGGGLQPGPVSAPQPPPGSVPRSGLSLVNPAMSGQVPQAPSIVPGTNMTEQEMQALIGQVQAREAARRFHETQGQPQSGRMP